MAPARARRNNRIDSVAIEQRADTVAVASQEPHQHGDKLSRDRAFFDLWAEFHRRAQVEQKPRGNFPILVVNSDIRRLQARRYIPVDVTNIVMILIFAEIGEIQSEAAKQSSIIAVEQSVEAANDGPLQAPE